MIAARFEYIGRTIYAFKNEHGELFVTLSTVRKGKPAKEFSDELFFAATKAYDSGEPLPSFCYID